MNKTAIKILSVLLMSAIIASALVSCDKIFQSKNDPETSAAETKGEADDKESENDTLSETVTDGDITESTDAESATDSEVPKDTSATDTDTKAEQSETADGNVSEDTSAEQSETTSAPTVERFDYSAADMSKYIVIDEALYKGFTATLPDYLDGSDGAVAKFIDLLCSQYPTSTGNKIVDRPIAEGDTVALYYEGWLGDDKFEGGSNMSDESPYMLTIGSGAFIPGFEDALIGIVPNETSRENLRDLHLTFPENYHSADLAGKSVIFKVYVEYIKEMAPAEYTEDFITQTLGYTASGSDVKAEFEKYLKEEYLPQMRYDEIDTLAWDNITSGAVVLQYPQSEIDYYYNSYIDQYEYYKQYYEYFGYTFSSLGEFVTTYLGLPADADWQATVREQCELDVMQTLAFHAIAQKEGISVADEAYADAIQYYVDYYLSQGYNVTAEQIVQELGDRLIREQALWTLVNDFIVANFIPQAS